MLASTTFSPTDPSSINTWSSTFNVSNTIVDCLESSVNTLSVIGSVNQTLNSTINGFTTESEICESDLQITYEANTFNGVISLFPASGVPEVQLPSVGVIYTTKTSTGTRGDGSVVPVDEA